MVDVPACSPPEWQLVGASAGIIANGEPSATEDRPGRGITAGAMVLGLAVAKLLLQMAAAHNYGYFRDELYFLDCSKHLAWGYLDQPPLIAGVAWVTRQLLGTSLLGLRFFPALAGSAIVILAALIARQLGGGRFAQALAALAVLVSPGYLSEHHLLTMNAFEPVFWTGCAYLLIRVIQSGNPRLWLWFGALAGLGLENKHSMLLFGFGIAVGLVLTPQRRLLWSGWVWLGALVAFLIFLPNLVWQIQHGFATLSYLNYHRHSAVNVRLTPLEFLGQQVLAVQPLAAPIWLAGLWYYLCAPEGRPYRALGWAYVIVLGLLLLLRGRVYYLLPVYPMLFGSGALVAERFFSARRQWVKRAYVTGLVLGAAFLAPFALPVFPVEMYLHYSKALRLGPPAIENRKLGKLPQLYADEFGWKEMAADVARAYGGLTPEQRSRTVIFANNYGEAGAIGFFGPAYGLPRAICPHQSYFDWGPGQGAAGNLLILGHSSRLEHECTREKQVGEIRNQYSMPYENFPLTFCSGLKRPLKELWPGLRKWEE